MSKKDAENRTSVVSIRFKPFEANRFWEIMDAVKARNPYVDRADVIRELLELAPLRAITAAEMRYFRTGSRSERTKRESAQAEQIELRLGPMTEAKPKRTNKGGKTNAKTKK